MKELSYKEGVAYAISEAMSSRMDLTEEMVFCFMEELAATGSFARDMRESDSYITLNDQLYELWQYREWEDMSVEQAFLYGQLYGCAKLCECSDEIREHTKRMTMLVSQYEEKLWLFRAIGKQPGIRHKDLAQEGNMSPSQLSQIMEREELKELLTYRLLGREKHYFLSPMGEELLSKLEEKIAKEALDDLDFQNDILIKNTRTDDVYIPLRVVAKEGWHVHFDALSSQLRKRSQTEWIKGYVNHLAMMASGKGEKECLAENTYPEKPTSLSTNGLQMSSVG